MNAPQALLDNLAGRGIAVQATGDALQVRPASRLTEADRQAIRQHKPALLALLLSADDTDETPPPAPRPAPFMVVRDTAGLTPVLDACTGSIRVALDSETTGLDPRKDLVRLLQLAPDSRPMVYVLDLFAIDHAALAPLWDVLTGKELVLHHAVFDLSFLWRLGLRPGKVCDLVLLSRLLTAGLRPPKKPGKECSVEEWEAYHEAAALAGNSLADLALRELGITLDKAHQKDDWSAPELSLDQLGYAALDAQVTLDLHGPVLAKIEQAGLERVAEIENRAVPAFVWLASSGAPFDPAAWEAPAVEAEEQVEALTVRLGEAAPPRPGDALGKARPDGGWNWGSPKQLAPVFTLLGIDLPRTEKGNPSTQDEALASIDHPFAALLREYRHASHLVKSFGRGWLPHADNGRIYAGWNQLGTAAGRSSCNTPNLQQVPRDPRYRACFKAPPGRVLVKADYGQLQLRIAAKIAAEARMIEAYSRGEDLHTLTARQLTGKPDVTKHDRQLAKAVNFGLLFGLGAKGLKGYAKREYDLGLTEAEAGQYRKAFFAAYPGLAGWHRQAGNSRTRECRTLTGRRRLLDEKTPYTHRLNTPVQGTEADGAKLAMALLWERRSEVPGAVPVLFVHDEIVVECDADQADAVAAWLKRAMLEAMAPLIAPVPVEVEVKIAPTWGGSPPADPSTGSTPVSAAPAPRLKSAGGEGSVADVLAGRRRWCCEQGDAAEWVRRLPEKSVDLFLFSPPYEDQRTYGIGFNLKGQVWVDWLVPIFTAALRACKGLVACVCEGKTDKFQWSGVPVLLMADLHRAGALLRKPPAYRRVDIPGSGGPDWLRNDYEFIVCATNGGKLPWSDNTAMGSPPKYPPGGKPSHRLVDGQRVNVATNGDGYTPPTKANPGNVIQTSYTAQEVAEMLGEPADVIDCVVGGGRMGSPLAHENEAPFPGSLAEFFIRSFCPPDGIVCDPFSGSGTTAAVAVLWGRRALACDMRQDEVELTRRRLAGQSRI